MVECFLSPSYTKFTFDSYPKIKEFYDLCLDTNTIDALGLQPLQKYWNQLVVNSVKDFMVGVGYLHSIQFPAFFSFSVTPDPENPQTLIGTVFIECS